MDPNQIQGEGWWSEAGDFPENLKLPEGVSKADLGRTWYAYYRLYRDGRREIEWRKRNSGQDGNDPIFTTTTDEVPGVRAKWEEDTKKAENQATPPGGIPTRTINGQVFQWNPQTRAYDIPTGQQPAASSGNQVPGDAVPRIEGTPLPGGGFDNEQPIKVWRRPDGTVVKSESLSAAERKQWDEDRERSRNPGGKTDADIKAEQTEAERRAKEAAAANKPGQPTLKPDGKGGTIAVQVMPDGSIKTTPLPDVPSEAASKYSEVKQDPSTGQWHGLTRSGTWEPISGGPGRSTKDDFTAEPEGAPAANFTPGQVAQGLQAYSNYLNQQVQLWQRTGGQQGIAPEKASRLMAQRISIAEAAGKEQDSLARTQQQVFGTQVVQRGQSVAETASRRGDANTAYLGNLRAILPQITMVAAGADHLPALAFQDSLRMNQQYVEGWGGLREHPEITVPTFLNQIREVGSPNLPMPGQRGAGGPLPAPGFTPGPGAPTGAPSMISPTARPDTAAGDPNARPTFLPQPEQALPPPIFRPQPPVAMPPAPAPAPPPPAPTVNPINNQPIVMPTPPTPVVPIYDQGGAYNPSRANGGNIPPGADFQIPPPPAPLVPAGGNVQLTPGMPFSPEQIMRAQQPTQGPQLDPAMFGHAAANPMIPPGLQQPSFLQQARYGVAWNPMQRGLELGIRPDILEMALAG